MTGGVVGSLSFLVFATIGVAQPLSIRGRVHVSGDSLRPVADAEVAVLPGLRTVRTDSAGAFHLRGLNAGLYTLRVRRVGFGVFAKEVSIRRGSDTTSLDIPLQMGSRILAEVVVSGHRVMYPARLAEPYARVSRGRGKFFTRELIDSLQPWDVSSLLQQVPGVGSSGVTRCQNHGATPGQPGNLHVFVDGVRQTNYQGWLKRGWGEVLRDVVITSVQLVEVHTSINTIPPEFAEDACAAILIWSR